ncbi:MAG: hypothetical protein JWO03_2118 [Bacteroidetes bacterium]|nr:hypothetical protein [Bacteroidota bacterium]
MRFTIPVLILIIAMMGCKTKQHTSTTTDMNKVPVGTSTTTTTTTTKTTKTTKTEKAEKDANDMSTETAPIPAQPATYGATAHAVIYKTKKDYWEYVPVTLTDDGSAIASYPAPGDVYYHGKIALPTKLADGYLLDNRGVTPHSAFVRIKYEDYAQLKEVPSLTELYKLVIDKTPFTEMYDLGERNVYENAPGTINTVIKENKLGKYKKLL